MALSILKVANKWLLTSFVLFTPYLTLGAQDYSDSLDQLNDCSFEPKSSAFNLFDSHTKNEQEVIRAFQRFTIDFHDYALANLWLTPPPPNYPPSIPAIDIQNISVLLSASSSKIDSFFLLQLLSEYLFAAQNYIGTFSSCTFPTSANQNASEWIRASVNIANYLNTALSLKPKQASELHQLFISWTEAQINYINNASPLCPARVSPIDAAASNTAYTQARAIAYRLATEIFRARK